MSTGRLAWAAGSAVVLLLAASPRARACSYTVTNHVIVPAMQAVDHTAPVLPAVEGLQVARGHGPQGDGCSSTVSSCDDLGSIALVAKATDDMTPPGKIGYRFTIIAGAAPEGFTLPTEAVEPNGGGVVSLEWIDGAFDDQDPLDMTLTVQAVDLAGNASAPQTIRVQQSAPGGGCRVAPGRSRGALLLAAILAVGACRDRRRNRRRPLRW